MILKRLVVGPIGTNCYLFGSSNTKEIVIIDPGGDANRITEEIEKLNAKPTAVLLTHGHFDHTLKIGKLKRIYDIPLKYNKQEFDSGVFNNREADQWLKEGNVISIGEIELKVLETPGHSPGSLCYFTIMNFELNNNKFEGVIFTGDLLFKGSIGRTDIGGGNSETLFASIRNKIMNNPNLSDDFLVLPGHMQETTIGQERNYNMFKRYFL